MSAIRLFSVLSVVALTGCSGPPDVYAPSIPRRPLNGFGISPIGSFIEMNDPKADAYLVRDVSHTVQSGTWRWAGQHALLRFYVDSTSRLKFRLNYSVPEITFKDTGPINLAVSINGNRFDTIACPLPGDQHFEKSVPASILLAKSINTVALEPDKMWTSPQGISYGFILTRAGFVSDR